MARSRASTSDSDVVDDLTYAKGARITGDSRDHLQAALREQYEAGASIRSLAERTGRYYGFVHKVLADSGAELRSRGGPNRTKASDRP